MKIVVKNLEGLLECFIPKRYATKMLGEALEVVNQFEDIEGLTCYEVKAEHGFRWCVPEDCVKEIIE